MKEVTLHSAVKPLAIERGHATFGGQTVEVAVRHGITYSATLDITGDIGNVTRLENLVNDGIGKKLTKMEESLKTLQGDLKAALESRGKPFEHAEELETKTKRLNQLNLELEVGKTDEVIMSDSEDENENRDNPEQDAPEHDNPEQDNSEHDGSSPDRDKPKPPHGRR